jgi:hypothetical protein
MPPDASSANRFSIGERRRPSHKYNPGADALESLHLASD